MFRKVLLLTLLSALLLGILAACGGESNGALVSKGHNDVSTGSSSQSTMQINASPTVSTGISSSDNRSGKGPLVIQTSTPILGGTIQGQQVVLPDRTLVIEHAQKQSGTDASLLAISVTMTLKNTGKQTIINRANYYQLMGAEGDIFGVQSTASANFFGTITASNARSGTIVFQVPAGVSTGLRLFYRSEITSETVIVPLHL